MSIAQGHTALRTLDRAPTMRARVMQVVAFSLAAAAVAGLWRLPWLDIATAGVSGLLIGLLDQYTAARPALKEASDALAALIAGTVATWSQPCSARSTSIPW